MCNVLKVFNKFIIIIIIIILYRNGYEMADFTGDLLLCPSVAVFRQENTATNLYCNNA